MKGKNEVSAISLIARGYLIVNIPVTVIILVVWFGLWSILNLNYVISLLLGTMTGWYYWSFSIKKWIRWAKNGNADEERILKIGRIGLLLWKRQTVTDALENEEIT